MNDAFSILADAIGPIGAIFAIAAGYFYSRVEKLQDKILSAFVADAQMKADMKNAMENLQDAIRESNRVGR